MSKKQSFGEKLENLKKEVLTAIETKCQTHKDENDALSLVDSKGDGAYIGIPDYDEYTDTPYIGTHEVTSLQMYDTMIVMVDECEEEFELTDLNIEGLIGLYEHMETIYKD